MSSILNKIYLLCPVFVQNLLVSMYGYKLSRQRFSNDFKADLKELIDKEKLSRDLIRNIQDNMFVDLLRHAANEVPFYKEFFENSRYSFSDIMGCDDLPKLPIVTKEMLRADPLRFCSSKYLKKKGTFWLHTSGTTGTPLRILCDNKSRQRHYLFWARFRQWCGLSANSPRATFFGRIIMNVETNKPPFYRYDYFGNNYLFSSYHLTKKNLKYYYDDLCEINPAELIGYPSSLFLLAKFCKENNLKCLRPKAVITTAETLLDNQRYLIEDVFQCRVYDQYGCTEMAIFVSQCEAGCYHLHPEHGFLEVLNSENKTVAPGEVGRAVCTGFINYAMPLIRYDLGDQLILSGEKCSCGRSFQIIKEIIGRLDDVLYSADGSPIPRLASVFKGIVGIFETQIVQHNVSSLQLNVVADNTFSKEEKEKLEYEVKKRVGWGMDLQIKIIDNIPKDKNGKFRSVISKIKKKDVN